MAHELIGEPVTQPRFQKAVDLLVKVVEYHHFEKWAHWFIGALF